MYIYLRWASISTPFVGATEIGYHFLSGDSSYKALIPWLNPRSFRDNSAAWSGLVRQDRTL